MSNVTEHKAGIRLDPRLIYEALGSKIIEFDSIAIAEQIKNATDAGAKEILIDFSKVEEDLILIKDKGSGMTVEEIQEKWFLVATSNKSSDLTQHGGKGIGRFSLFRLAEVIEIETISNGKKCHFKMVKSDLENQENLTDYSIDIYQSDTNEANGTTIKLTKLNNINLPEIREDLENLNLPFKNKTFKIIYPKNNSFVKYEDPKKCISEAPFYAEIEFIGSKILSYEFQCNYHGKLLYENNDLISLQKSINEIITSEQNIGKTKAIIYNFYFDKKYSNITFAREKELKSDFLSAYQGINVYRSNFKIYGHGKEDWLKLAEKRLKKSGENIDNKLTFGYVLLDPINSANLEEKTSREGFIRNETSSYFHEIIDLIVTQFGSDREKSIDKIKDFVKIPKRPNLLTETDEDDSEKNGTSEGDSGKNGTSEGDSGKNSTGEGDSGKNSTGEGGPGKNDTGEGDSGKNDTGEGDSGKNNTGEGDSGKNDTGEGDSGKNSTGEGDSDFKNRYNKKTNIGVIAPEIKDNIKSQKVSSLVNEITTINVDRYTLATGFLLRSLTEVMMDEYLRIYLINIKEHFKDYIIDSNNNIKKSYYNKKTKANEERDVTIKAKLMDFKKYLSSTGNFDNRSLKHLDYLVTCIDDINLAMHWTHKTVGKDQLQTNWQNSIFFIEFICKSI